MAERPGLPTVDRSRCTGCGDCVPACGPGVLALAGSCVELVNPDACDYCGECEAICDEDAISCPYDIVLDGNDQRLTDA